MATKAEKPAPPLMPAPELIPGCPPGLEYLTQIDQLLVHQQIELLEIMTGFETENKYLVRNTLGQQVYFAAEHSGFISRQLCDAERAFEMSIVDNNKQEVIHLSRPLRCPEYCCCYLQEMEVQCPPGTPVGYVKQEFTFKPGFVIENADHEPVLRIRGPWCTCKWCENEFQVLSADRSQEVGKITKQWSGLAKEWFTDADNFGIQFPMDLDVKVKAVLLGACFLIDFMYYEDSDND